MNIIRLYSGLTLLLAMTVVPALAADAPLGLTPPPPAAMGDKAVLVVPHPDHNVLLRNRDALLVTNKRLV